jgi:xanthine/CO dehydrogenase XdhC/CoxF family maturation factor
LLLTRGSRRAGSVSGGCLEEDLAKKAWWLTENGPAVKRYDTTPDGEIASGFGLGCSGVIHVFLERLSPSDDAVFTMIEDVRSLRRPAVIAHVIDPAEKAGKRLIVDSHGKATHNITDAVLASDLERAGRNALSETCSRTERVSEDVEAFIEVVAPAVRLLIFGAGDDAIPLTQLAKYLGWQVTVVDGRAHYARRERFPSADEVILCSEGRANATAPIDRWTAAVLMSHSYSQDLQTLRELSGTPLSYLGILGPRKRTVRLISDAALDGSRFGAGLYSPIGLDIGADGPEQVALAVVAEIQAVLNGRGGGLLRERSGSIHSREEGLPETESVWLQPTCV